MSLAKSCLPSKPSIARISSFHTSVRPVLTTFAFTHTSCRAEQIPHTPVLRRSYTTTTPKMSFSNADTGDKPADPYKATNLDTPDLKVKVEELTKFIDSCKFGMMTTRIESSGLLTSRCMAIAAKVILSHSASTVETPMQI